MNRRLTALILSAAAALGLCGCSRVLDAEYVVETSFEPVLPAVESEVPGANVASFDELKEVLSDMVADGAIIRSLRFDAGYPGDVSADLASACWQVRTQDALCAYCVENIAYELSKIINHYEALVTIVYSKTEEDRERILSLPYAADAEELLRSAMREGTESLVLLIERSGYTAEGMEAFARGIYLSQPAIAPQEPSVRVEMTSGADTQRLYEIFFDYGLPAGELAERSAALSRLDLFAGIETETLSEAERALLACCALTVRSRAFEGSCTGSIYDALILREADCRGMALAYVELCRELGLNCQMVEGQRNREDHCWTIVEIDGEYYHVDPAACDQFGLRAGFLLSDEDAWGDYRWDYFDYPHCIGTLDAAAVSYPRGAGAPLESFFPGNENTP